MRARHRVNLFPETEDGSRKQYNAGRGGNSLSQQDKAWLEKRGALFVFFTGSGQTKGHLAWVSREPALYLEYHLDFFFPPSIESLNPRLVSSSVVCLTASAVSLHTRRRSSEFPSITTAPIAAKLNEIRIVGGLRAFLLAVTSGAAGSGEW